LPRARQPRPSKASRSAAAAPAGAVRGARAEATRLELLLAAEKLFALHGLMGVSLRQIVAATQQRNLSTVHYHFGSREALVYAICDLRMPAIEAERAERLARYAGHPPAPAQRPAELLRILIEPSALPIFASRGRSHFRRMLAHTFVSSAMDLPAYLIDRYDTSIRVTAGLMRQTLPHLCAETFAVRWKLLIRAVTYVLASMETRAEQATWRKGEAELRKEIDAMSAAFAGFFAAPDEAQARGSAADTKPKAPRRRKK